MTKDKATASTKDAALKLALEIALDKEYQLRKTGQSHMIEPVIAAIKEALAQPAPVECDIGVLCIGCTPRNSDGSCPSQKPNGACNCYEKGFRDGSNEFKELYAAQPEQETEGKQFQAKFNLEDRAVKTYHEGKPVYVSQPEQEPVCEITVKNGHWIDTNGFSGVKDLANGIHKLYTTPQASVNEAPKRPWVGLTHQQTKDCVRAWDGNDAYYLCRAIEAKLEEKNT